MKKYIVRYLTENYFLDEDPLGDAAVYGFDECARTKVKINPKKLIEEIVTIFGYSFTRTKWFIHNWAEKQVPSYNLKKYWEIQEYDGLVRVEPMGSPTGILFYLDYQYGEQHHPTPNYMLAVDPATPDSEPSIFKVEGIDAMRLQRERTLQKWLDSGLLDGMDEKIENIALLYEAQAKQFLK